MAVDQGESRPGTSGRKKVAALSKRKLPAWPPTVIITQGSSGVIRTRACVGHPGHLHSQLP